MPFKRLCSSSSFLEIDRRSLLAGLELGIPIGRLVLELLNDIPTCGAKLVRTGFPLNR